MLINSMDNSYNVNIMKTIKELNGKWWYRLIKVAYVLLLMVVSISFLVLPYLIFEHEDEKSGLNEEEMSRLTNLLDSRKSSNFSDMSNSITKPNNFESIVVNEDGNWFLVLLWSLSGLLGSFLVFEIIRRIFYYVILGSFKPNKE